MGLGLSEGGGEFTPYLKYSAKSGRWTNRVESGDSYVDAALPDADVVFLADFENIEVGWSFMAEGQAPDKHFVKFGQPMPPKPSPAHKSGFRLMVYSEKNLGGLREFSSISGLVNQRMNELYDAYEKQRGANPGKCPVVKFTGIDEVGKNKNYQPRFEIVQWPTARAAFDEDGDGGSASQPVAHAQAAPAAAAPPPPIAQAAAPTAGGVEF